MISKFVFRSKNQVCVSIVHCLLYFRLGPRARVRDHSKLRNAIRTRRRPPPQRPLRAADEEAATTATKDAEPAGAADEEAAEPVRVAGKEAEAAAKM